MSQHHSSDDFTGDGVIPIPSEFAEASPTGSLDHHRPATTRPTTSYWLCLAALLILASGLRLFGLGREALWTDEAASLHAARGSLYDVWLHYNDYENTPPLYYVFLNCFGKVFGTESDAIVRLPSAIFGILAVFLAWLLAKRITRSTHCTASQVDESLPTLVAAAGIVALSLQQIWFSQEARAYSLFAMASILSSIALLRALDKPTAPRYTAYVLCSLIMCYAHFAAVGVLVAQGLAGLTAITFKPNRDRLAFIGSQFSVALLASPLVPIALKTRGRMLGPNDRTIELAIQKFGETFTFLFENIWLLIPIVLLAMIGLTRSRASLSQKVLLIGLIVLPPLPPLVGWYTGGAQYFARHALPCGIALSVAAGMGIACLPRSIRWPATVLLLVATTFTLWIDRDTFRKPAMREAASYIAANAQPGDTVVASLMMTGWSFDRYFPRTDVRRRNYDEFTIKHVVSSGSDVNRVWVLFFQIPPDLRPFLKDSPMEIVEQRNFHQILVWKLERPKTGAVEVAPPN